jgi:hypothetical protein
MAGSMRCMLCFLRALYHEAQKRCQDPFLGTMYRRDGFELLESSVK